MRLPALGQLAVTCALVSACARGEPSIEEGRPSVTRGALSAAAASSARGALVLQGTLELPAVVRRNPDDAPASSPRALGGLSCGQAPPPVSSRRAGVLGMLRVVGSLLLRGRFSSL
jgi:hypothetical protein